MLIIQFDSEEECTIRFDKDGFRMDPFFKKEYDRQGYDKEGYNIHGYDRQGNNRHSIHDRCDYFYNERGEHLLHYDHLICYYIYNAKGYDQDGNYKDSKKILKKNYDRQGHKKYTGSLERCNYLYDENGNHIIHDSDLMCEFCYNKEGFNQDGYDFYGYDDKGFDQDGFDRNGFRKDGIHNETNTKYNEKGYDCKGYDENGIHKYGLVWNEESIQKFKLKCIPYDLNHSFWKDMKNKTIKGQPVYFHEEINIVVSQDEIPTLLRIKVDRGFYLEKDLSPSFNKIKKWIHDCGILVPSYNEKE